METNWWCYIKCVMNKYIIKIMASTILFILLLINPISRASAESCGEVTHCVGKVFYLQIPRSQFKSKTIFSTSGLPAVNSTLIVSRRVSLVYPTDFANQPFTDLVKNALKEARKNNNGILVEYGTDLDEGSKVKILSYHAFSTLGDMSGELFALVLVISE